MRYVGLVALLLIGTVGCSFRIPTPEQRAQLRELGAGMAELTAELDAVTGEIKLVVEGVRDGSVSAAEAAVLLAKLYEKRAKVEGMLAKLKVADKDLRAQGVNAFFIILSTVLGIAVGLLGGKANALRLVGVGLSKVLESAKSGGYKDGDTKKALEVEGASLKLAETLRK